jgi:hypothetical protein
MSNLGKNGSLGLARLAAAMFLALMLAGCATVRHGGAPEPAFNYEKDLQDLETLFAPAASIAAVGANPTDAARNSFMDGRIALYNIRYIRFVRDLGVDKQHLDAATDILILGLSVAGASTGALRAKTNLATAAAAVTGTKIAIDKHFYFDKTIQALVSTMNAQRKTIMVRMIDGRSKTVSEYPLLRVLDDLSDYELAGTLIGAINVLQADAADKEKNADEVLRTLVIPTEAELAEKRKLAKALTSLNANTPSNLERINKILKERKVIAADIKVFGEAVGTLLKAWRADSNALVNLPDWRKAISTAGVTIQD